MNSANQYPAKDEFEGAAVERGHRRPESWANQVNVGYDEEQDALNREELNGDRPARVSYNRAGSQRVANAENRTHEKGDDEVQPTRGILLD